MKRVYLLFLCLIQTLLLSSCNNKKEIKEIKSIDFNLEYVDRHYVIGEEVSYYGLQILALYEGSNEYCYLDDYSLISLQVMDLKGNIVIGKFISRGKYIVNATSYNGVSNSYEIMVYVEKSYSLLDALIIANKNDRNHFGDTFNNKWSQIDSEGVFYGLGSNIARKSMEDPLRLQLQMSDLSKQKIRGLAIKAFGPCKISIPFITESSYGKYATLSVIDYVNENDNLEAIFIEDVGKSLTTAYYELLTYEYNGNEEKMIYFCSLKVPAAIGDVIVTYYI